MRNISLILVSIIFIFGLIGNLLIIMVLRYEQSLRPFTKMLMVFQAIFDVSALMSSYFQILAFVKFDLYLLIKFEIRMIINYLLSLSMDMSSWVICLLNIDRMCLILWPTNRLIRRLSYKEACIIIAIMVVCSTIINVGQYFKGASLKIISTKITLACQTIIPFLLISCSSIIILYKLRKYSKQINPNSNSNSNMLRSSILAIKMIIVVSIYHLIVLLFAFVMFLYLQGLDANFPALVLSEVGLLLTISNYSIKFYLYNLSTPHMRRELVRIFHSMKIGIMSKINDASHG